MKPLVSVVIPTFNSARYLEKSLFSIVNQTYKNIEILIIDDTPNDDGTKVIIESFHDDRIKYIKPATRLGMVKSINYGVEIAKGEYIARMDADDISHKRRFEIQIEFLQRHPGIGVVGSAAYIINEQDKITGIMQFASSDEEIKKKMIFNCPFIHPVMMMRANLIKENKYDEECFCCEDYELWSRLIAKTKFYNLSQNLLKYRVYDNSTNETQLEKIKTDEEYYKRHLIVMKKIYENVYKSFGIPYSKYKEYNPELVFAKRIDAYTLKERYNFLISYSQNMRWVDSKINYGYVGYQWLKMAGREFWKTSDIYLLYSSLLQIFLFGYRKMKGIVYGKLEGNKNVIDWKL